MKFTFKKLGKLDEAEIEVKDLTIVCGENNTGKTYLLYAIYGFWAYLVRSGIPFLSDGSREVLKTQKKIVLNIEETFSIEKINDFLGKVAEEYASTQIHRDFVANPKFFENLKMNIELSHNDCLQVINDLKLQVKNDLKRKFQSLQSGIESSNGQVVTFNFAIKDNFLHITQEESNLDISHIFSILNREIKESVFQSFYKNNFFSTSERTGIVIFKEELDFKRRQLLEFANKAKEVNHMELFNHFYMDYKDTYSKPIKDEAEFIRNLLAYAKLKRSKGVKESEQSLLNMKQLEDIIGGILELSSDGTIYFKPNKNKSLRLTMDHVSSSIRSILSLYFYIRDQGHKENQLLMIDEPEMNLHPKNQRAMARFLATLVNQGIKVMVSTHSDYLVRELNHLTALYKFKDQDLVKTYIASEDNPYSEEVLISNEKVGLYFTRETGKSVKSVKKVKLHEAPISQYGSFTVASFDNEIKAQQQAEFDILEAIHGRNGDED